LQGAEINENPEIHESDLPHHFRNGKDKDKDKDDSKNSDSLSSGVSTAPAPGNEKGDKGPGAKGGKPKEEKDVQLDRAIDILKHWSTYKLQLAKGESMQQAASESDSVKSKGD
jgi:hypothetical protein